MQKKVKSRLQLIILYLMLGSCGIYLILYNLEENIVFFYPPSKINEVKNSKEFRIGGLVKSGSITKIGPDQINFIITDNIADLEISYQGIVPALFRENQGIIAVGKLDEYSQRKTFIARELLTKHDENYYPPSIDPIVNSK